MRIVHHGNNRRAYWRKYTKRTPRAAKHFCWGCSSSTLLCIRRGKKGQPRNHFVGNTKSRQSAGLRQRNSHVANVARLFSVGVRLKIGSTHRSQSMSGSVTSSFMLPDAVVLHDYASTHHLATQGTSVKC